jgi:hypothetical protein
MKGLLEATVVARHLATSHPIESLLDLVQLTVLVSTVPATSSVINTVGVPTE